MEEALHPEVTDAETQDRELVQLGDDVWRKWQQAGQVVQLGVETVSVPLGRVRLLGPHRGLPVRKRPQSDSVTPPEAIGHTGGNLSLLQTGAAARRKVLK